MPQRVVPARLPTQTLEDLRLLVVDMTRYQRGAQVYTAAAVRDQLQRFTEQLAAIHTALQDWHSQGA